MLSTIAILALFATPYSSKAFGFSLPSQLHLEVSKAARRSHSCRFMAMDAQPTDPPARAPHQSNIPIQRIARSGRIIDVRYSDFLKMVDDNQLEKGR